MASLTFDEVAKLINHSRVTEIDCGRPREEDPGKWALYSGMNRVPNFKYPFSILFLGAACSQEGIKSAGKSLSDPSNTHVVFAPSLRIKREQIENLLGKKVAGIGDTKDFLFSFVRDQLSKYQAKLSVPSWDFVEPFFEVPSGFKHKRPNPLMLFLEQSYKEDQGELAVLLGEPGQGKTYTAKYVAYEVCTRRVSIPIFIHAPQWASMSPGDLGSIWKTITHSFKYFETPIDWIEGCEEEFISVSLKSGLFSIIFDGLDEYVLWNRGKIGAVEARDNLLRLAASSGSRILTTCRTSFWKSNFEHVPNDEESPALLVYTLKPFDRNQAREYFRKRIPDSEERLGSAMAIYSRFSPSKIDDTPSNFVGRGFILNLIADLVSRSATIPALGNEKTNVIRWIISALCEREEKRQKLPISPETQIRIFEDCAEEIARGHTITDETLTTLIQFSALPSNEELGSLVGDSRKRGSLQDHPLIRRLESGHWEFVHEQVLFNLLAQRLTECVEQYPERLRNLLPYLRIEGSLLTDLATALVDQLFTREESEESIHEAIQTHVGAIVQCCASPMTREGSVKNGTILATTLAMLALNRLMPGGQQHKERTLKFLSFFPGSILHGVTFTGTLSKMDLSGLHFEDCSFQQVTWANCEFDSKTKFERCVFVGGKVTFCRGFGQAEWVGGHFDTEANAMIKSEQAVEGKRKYTNADLRYDMEQVIKKFVPKEGVGLKSVYEPHLYSGAIAASIYSKMIIETLKRHLLEENRVSGVTDPAYHIKESAKAAVQHYASNGVFTGALAEAFSELVKLLKLT
jgi:hypothetical protein